MTTLAKLQQERQALKRFLSNGGLPKVLNSGQLDEILPIFSTEHLYATGTLGNAGYSEQAMYGYVMCLQHVRELLSAVTQSTESEDGENYYSDGGGNNVLLVKTEDS